MVRTPTAWRLASLRRSEFKLLLSLLSKKTSAPRTIITRDSTPLVAIMNSQVRAADQAWVDFFALVRVLTSVFFPSCVSLQTHGR